ncbi:MAG: transposase [Methanobacteriales archaeon]
MIRRNFPEVKKKLWKNVLWSPSYFLATSGQVTLGCFEEICGVTKVKTMPISYF